MKTPIWNAVARIVIAYIDKDQFAYGLAAWAMLLVTVVAVVLLSGSGLLTLLGR